MSSYQDKLRAALYDSCKGEKCEKKDEDGKKVKAKEAAADFAEKSLALDAVYAVHDWVETEDLEEGESLADELIDEVIEAAVGDVDPEDISEADEEAADAAVEAAFEYLLAHGVTEEDAEALFDGDDEAAERIRELLADTLPDGEEADEEIYDHVFDAVKPGMVGKRFITFKGGKKHIGRHRKISARLRMIRSRNAKKNRAKMHSGAARAKRMRSMRLRRKSGL